MRIGGGVKFLVCDKKIPFGGEGDGVCEQEWRGEHDGLSESRMTRIF